MNRRLTMHRCLMLVGCWIGFAALPLAHTITSTVAREASSPVEESPVCFYEAALVRNAESRAPSDDDSAASSWCVSSRPDSAVSPCLLLSGHRWANGLLAPLRT